MKAVTVSLLVNYMLFNWCFLTTRLLVLGGPTFATTSKLLRSILHGLLADELLGCKSINSETTKNFAEVALSFLSSSEKLYARIPRDGGIDALERGPPLLEHTYLQKHLYQLLQIFRDCTYPSVDYFSDTSDEEKLALGAKHATTTLTNDCIKQLETARQNHSYPSYCIKTHADHEIDSWMQYVRECHVSTRDLATEIKWIDEGGTNTFPGLANAGRWHLFYCLAFAMEIYENFTKKLEENNSGLTILNEKVQFIMVQEETKRAQKSAAILRSVLRYSYVQQSQQPRGNALLATGSVPVVLPGREIDLHFLIVKLQTLNLFTRLHIFAVEGAYKALGDIITFVSSSDAAISLEKRTETLIMGPHLGDRTGTESHLHHPHEQYAFRTASDWEDSEGLEEDSEEDSEDRLGL